MLLCRATESGAGCVLCGDYWDLKTFYDTVTSIADAANLSEELGNQLFGFAYDLRMAYMGNKETVTIGYDELDRVEYRGSRHMWPGYLFVVALLRSSAGWVTTSKQDQANLYLLEATTHSALVTAGADAEFVQRWITHFRPTNDYLIDWVEDANHRYIYGRKRGKRIQRLTDILLSLYETSKEYREFEVAMRRAAMREDCKPNNLVLEREWPQFRW
ncbi:MAG TPA: hypothetical protein VF092_09540 [Longimicrobium sp.]